MSYGRYTKKSVFAFFAPPKSLFVRNLITATKKEKKREKKSERERERETKRERERERLSYHFNSNLRKRR
jgi:hypothetical protein